MRDVLKTADVNFVYYNKIPFIQKEAFSSENDPLWQVQRQTGSLLECSPLCHLAVQDGSQMANRTTLSLNPYISAQERVAVGSPTSPTS